MIQNEKKTKNEKQMIKNDKQMTKNEEKLKRMTTNDKK